MTRGRRKTSRFLFGSMALATLVATIALSPGTASAQDNSKDVGNCTIYAYDPTADYAANTATASGRVQCNNRHVIVITVYLQINKAGKWSNTAHSSKAVKGEIGVSDSVTSGCSRFPSLYRTKVVASIDGGKDQSVVTINTYLKCPLSPQ